MGFGKDFFHVSNSNIFFIAVGIYLGLMGIYWLSLVRWHQSLTRYHESLKNHGRFLREWNDKLIHVNQTITEIIEREEKKKTPQV